MIAVLESKGKLRGKTKAQKKKEEKDKKSTVKTQGDELKDNLADNDDSSSTTTETSNPDVETNIKEVQRGGLRSRRTLNNSVGVSNLFPLHLLLLK